MKTSENISSSSTVKLGFISFVSGTITSFGISGSLILATGLYFMKFKPSTLTSFTRLGLFSSSLAAVLQFLIAGYLDISDALIIASTSLIGSFIGIYFYNKDSKKGIKTNQKMITIILFTILTVSIFLMPFIINFETKHNPNAYTYGHIC